MKYSKNFERDYNFYLQNINQFNFCGTLNPRHEATLDVNGLDPKDCFFLIESQGKNKPCNNPELLNKLLLTKASVNFQIKEWAISLKEGTMMLFELSHRYWESIGGMAIDSSILEWIDNEPVYFKDMETLYQLPEWVIIAVDNQRKKIA